MTSFNGVIMKCICQRLRLCQEITLAFPAIHSVGYSYDIIRLTIQYVNMYGNYIDNDCAVVYGP